MRGRKPEMKPDQEAVKEARPAPAWLSKEAKAEWRRVMPILIERRILTDADLGILESYCVATGIVREAQRLLSKDGLVLEGKRHPAFGMMNAAQTNQRLCAAELGLTPVSRSRPSIRDDDDDEDSSNLGL
jgi:P27 family predicted phage terminase small subunit